MVTQDDHPGHKNRAMSKFNIAEAKSRFSELVQKAMLGEEVIIAKDNKPVLKLVPLEQPRQPRKPGSGKGQILHIAPDFDATPEVFQD
jgi:prevent-host-death family protein